MNKKQKQEFKMKIFLGSGLFMFLMVIFGEIVVYFYGEASRIIVAITFLFSALFVIAYNLFLEQMKKSVGGKLK